MQDSLQKAVMHVLAPLVRLLLRHGVSHAAFSDWARQVYVRQAEEHFGIDGRTPSVSRIAILTGINRKEVKRLRELPAAVDTGISRHNRVIRVVTGWLQDPDFQDEAGRPLALDYGRPEDGFNRLVRRHGGDVPARALLDELERGGSVSRDGDRVTLDRQGYRPHRSEEAMLTLFATGTADLLTTLEHNLAGGQPPRLQLSVTYDHVTPAGLEAFRTLSAERAMALLRELDTALSAHDRDVNGTAAAADPGEPRHRTGLGVYFIEERS